MTTLDGKTVISLKLEMICNGNTIGTGTGYFEEIDEKHYLVSNYHILAGRDPVTDKPTHLHAAIPDKVRIYCHESGKLGNFIPIEKDLYDDQDMSLYKIHATPEIDVAILPFNKDAAIDIYPIEQIDRLSSTNIAIYPSRKISIIGFPYGLSSFKYFPIWKTGNISSEVDLPFLNKPCFSIDAATRGGMSGSPVYALIDPPYQTGGYTILAGAVKVVFMGTYSGRMNIPPTFLANLDPNDQALLKQLGSDLGICWYEENTVEILKHGKSRSIA